MKLLKQRFISKTIGNLWLILPNFLRIRLPLETKAWGLFKSGKTIKTFRWHLHPWELIGRKYFSVSFSKYEPDTQELLKFILKNSDSGVVFLNVGANVGIWALLVSKWCPTSRIILVEPLPRNIELARLNILSNKVRNIELLPIAASERNKELIIFENRDLLGLSSVSLPTPYPVHVSARRLDEVVKVDVNIILIDVEGYELECLLGLRRILERNKPFVIVESSESNLGNVAKFMEELGYKVPYPIGKNSFHAQSENFLFQHLENPTINLTPNSKSAIRKKFKWSVPNGI